MGQSLTSQFDVTAETSSSIDVRARVIYNTTLAVDDTSNTCTVIGDFGTLGPGSLHIVTSSQQVIFDNTVTFTKQYGATQSKTMQASVTGINFWGSSQVIDIGTKTFVVPARAFELPAAVTGLTVTRVSDGRQDLAWVNTSPGSASAPYQAIDVMRRDNVNTSWVLIATIDVAQAFVDATTGPDRSCEYQVFPKNSTGLAASSPTATIRTTPAQPATVVAVRDGADIVVTFTDQSSVDDGHVVERQADGGAWVAAATLAVGVTSYRHVAPAAGSVWKYRVNSFVSSPALASTKVESNQVQLASPPSPPTSLSPAGLAAEGNESQTFGWVHVPTDSSPQTKRQLRFRRAGTTTWVEGAQVSTSTESVAITPISFLASIGITITNGQSLEWQVRTWGTHVNPSDWSSTATLTLSSRPTVTISAPGTTLDTSLIVLQFAYYDAEGSAQSAYRAQLLNAAGALLEERTGTGATSQVTFATPAPNGATLTVRVQVADSTGMWSAWTQRTLTVTYLPPATVTPTVTFDQASKTAVMALAADAAVAGVTVPAMSVTVERSIDGGPYRVIAAGVAPTATLLDAAPTIHGVNRYRLTVYSALPSSAVTSPVDLVTSERKWAVLSTGLGWSTRVYVWADIAADGSYGRQKALVEYHGRDFPVEYAGQMRKRTFKVSAKLTADSSTEAELIALAESETPVLWRDPDGRHMVCSISDVSIARKNAAGVQAVSFTLTRIDSNA